ncbi:MAG TPA: YicC/YloC family endoribonuclease [Bacillota bacterium]|nr:YicC/YloC family endoribonuclease [Bacillota bacterium]
MVLSMTGFGRGKSQDENREISIELKTINHRYLDINLRMSRSLSFLEENIRKALQASLTRGRVEIYLNYVNNTTDKTSVVLNETLAKSYIDSLSSLAENFGLSKNIDLSILAGIDDIFTVTESEEDTDLLSKLSLEALNEALTALGHMREKEGSFLVEDILKRTSKIEDMLNEIDKRSPLVVEEYRNKLEARLTELLKSTELEENRFNTEVAYYADRSNITEEIIRLRSHLSQLRLTMEQGGPIGRKLDFIVQEMNRETNTIGSKSGDIQITNNVVEIKSEIEKIREQIQNIE